LKGLGSSDARLAKTFFSDMDKHQKDFAAQTIKDSECIDMVFRKDRVPDRKKWLNSIDPLNTFFDYSKKEPIQITEFINKDMVLFSHYDVHRSIPSMTDGFKPSQRKIMFSCFKRKLTDEIKVAQLSGYVSENTSYHHGETSLQMAIVGMAQDFVGSNNINLLFPSGQFGTRRMMGSDSASARYIFTRLQKITRKIFHPDDDQILNYLDDDGTPIEPAFYVPVIPMILTNSSIGIGTGWSTSIPGHNPQEIIQTLRNIITSKKSSSVLHPFYNGYKGEINKADSTIYEFVGKIESIPDRKRPSVRITELPVGKSTADYKAFIDAHMTGTEKGGKEGLWKDFVENHTDTTVDFTIIMKPEHFKKASKNLLKCFKLTSTTKTTNMHAFDENLNIKKYKSSADIMNEFTVHQDGGYE